MNFHKRQVLCFGGKVFPNDTALRRPRARPPFPHDSAGQCVTAVGSPSGTHNPVVRGLGRVVGPHRGPTTVTRRRRPFGAAPPPVPPPISDCALRRAPRRHRGARRAARRRKSRVPCMPRRRARPQATRGSRARAVPARAGPDRRAPGPPLALPAGIARGAAPRLRVPRPAAGRPDIPPGVLNPTLFLRVGGRRRAGQLDRLMMRSRRGRPPRASPDALGHGTRDGPGKLSGRDSENGKSGRDSENGRGTGTARRPSPAPCGPTIRPGGTVKAVRVAEGEGPCPAAPALRQTVPVPRAGRWG